MIIKPYGWNKEIYYKVKKAYAVNDACLSWEEDYFPGVSAYVDIMYSIWVLQNNKKHFGWK